MSKMRNSCLLVGAAMLLVVAGTATQSEAAVNIQIGLPSVSFAAPPEVVVIPGTYVYMVPGIESDVLFFQGYWWRPYEGRWYRSRDYNRGWSRVDSRRVPGGLRGLPHDYRSRVSASGHERIGHRDVRNNWKKWEKTKHWDNRPVQGGAGHGKQGPSGQGGHDRRDR